MASDILGKPTFSPGPLLYWLLAVPTRLPYAPPFPAVMGAVNVAAIVGVVGLAHRRAGRPLMFATAAAVALMCGSLQTEVLSEVFNPSAALLDRGLANLPRPSFIGAEALNLWQGGPGDGTTGTEPWSHRRGPA